MRFVYLAAILAVTLGVPLTLQPVFALADQQVEVWRIFLSVGVDTH